MRAVRRKLLRLWKKKKEKKKRRRRRKPVVMSHIVLIPDWSVVLAESSPLLFLFPSLSLFFYMFLNYPFCLLEFFFLCLSPLLILSFSLPSSLSSLSLSFLFQKYLWSLVAFFFPSFSLLVQYRPQSGHIHTSSLVHSHSCVPSIFKKKS